MNNIVIINLNRASERKEKISLLLKERNINAIFYSAVDGQDFTNSSFILKLDLPHGYRYKDNFKPGEIGCTLSHIGVISMAKALNWDYVIVLEDDINICQDFNLRIEKLFKIVPKDWEHIYLSGTPHHNGTINHNFLQVVPSVKTDCTHSYIINKNSYDKVIKKLLSMKTTTDDLYNDMILHEKNLKSYTFYPFVTHSNSSYSYIWEKSAGHNIKNESKLYFKDKL